MPRKLEFGRSGGFSASGVDGEDIERKFGSFWKVMMGSPMGVDGTMGSVREDGRITGGVGSSGKDMSSSASPLMRVIGGVGVRERDGPGALRIRRRRLKEMECRVGFEGGGGVGVGVIVVGGSGRGPLGAGYGDSNGVGDAGIGYNGDGEPMLLLALALFR